MLWFYLQLTILLVALSFGLGAFFGAPWVPAFRQDFDELFKLAGVKKNTRFIDLGCGDGKILLAAAAKGAEVTGYEINPILWLIAWVRLLPYGKRAHVNLGSYWGHNIAAYDVVWIFLIDRYMPRMQKKLVQELAPKTTVISYIFSFPQLKPRHTTRNSFLYTRASFGKITS